MPNCVTLGENMFEIRRARSRSGRFEIMPGVERQCVNMYQELVQRLDSRIAPELKVNDSANNKIILALN
jgi:hypothetical protein